MDYIGINCPVCNKAFESGEDVVVCPECGTPHHRECYENIGHCIYEDKHNDGFEYSAENNITEYTENQQSQSDTDVILCPRCKSEIPKNMYYCGKCGFPVGIHQNNTAQNNGQPYTMPGMSFDVFDPMGGIPPETDMGDGVTAGEMSKYVQKSTSYFTRVFLNIKKINKGRFNFSAFLFSGGYLLYRKMYKIGAAITAIMLLLMLAEVYICFTPAYQELVDILNNAMANNNLTSYGAYFNSMTDSLSALTGEMQAIMGFIYASQLVQFVIRIVVGVKANKWYFKHCKKQISSIKKNSENADSDLETKGGVNVAIAISLFIVYLVISYLPSIILSLNIF